MEHGSVTPSSSPASPWCAPSTQSRTPDVIAAFLTDYQKSVKAANEDIDGTAALCEEVGVVAKAAIAKKALPKCNIVYRNGQEMKKDISAYLRVLYDASPAAVGGKLPDDNFYYTEPSVLRKVMARSAIPQSKL